MCDGSKQKWQIINNLKMEIAQADSEEKDKSKIPLIGGHSAPRIPTEAEKAAFTELKKLAE